MKNLIQSLIILLLLAACGKAPQISTNLEASTPTGIIGGTQAERSDLVTKSTVAFLHKVIINGWYEVNCSGTLISKNLILTAAHCLHSAKDLKTSAIYFGIILPFTKMEHTREIESWMEFPKPQPIYDQNGTMISQLNDLALIKIKGEAPEGFVPVKLAGSINKFQTGDLITVAGFGIKNDAFKMKSEGLRHVSVSVAEIWNTHIVTNQTQDKGVCLGDSGGPAYIEENGELLLVGATRGAHKAAADCRAFAEITSVPANLDFILEASKSLSQSLPEVQW